MRGTGGKHSKETLTSRRGRDLPQQSSRAQSDLQQAACSFVSRPESHPECTRLALESAGRRESLVHRSDENARFLESERNVRVPSGESSTELAGLCPRLGPSLDERREGEGEHRHPRQSDIHPRHLGEVSPDVRGAKPSSGDEGGHDLEGGPKRRALSRRHRPEEEDRVRARLVVEALRATSRHPHGRECDLE